MFQPHEFTACKSTGSSKSLNEFQTSFETVRLSLYLGDYKHAHNLHKKLNYNIHKPYP